MKSKALKRQHDSLVIPEGFYQEEYTPIAGRIISPSLGKPLAFAKAILAQDADVTWVDSMGNLVTAFPLSKGPFPGLVREIRTVSGGGRVIIVHDGILGPSEMEMTSANY